MGNIIHITKRTVDNAVIDSFFDARGYTDNDRTALKRIIADLEFKGVEYTMSTYVKKLYREVYGND